MNYFCSCGARFTSPVSEAHHRHNFPAFCKKRRRANSDGAEPIEPGIGDTVEFSAVGKYGAIDNARGIVTHVYKKGGVKVASEYGTFTLQKNEFFVLARAA